MPLEPPEPERFAKDVYVYDRPSRKWQAGERRDILLPQEIITLVWTNTGVNTDVTPDEDKAIDVEFAQRIAIQIDSTHPSNTSTDIDINVEATLDGGHWDTIPYAERNLGDAKIKTFLVEVSVKQIRLRLDNNATATTGYVTARVKVVK